MKKDKSSETAAQMALSRAIESLKTEDERSCYDPMAKDFLPLNYKILIKNKLLRNSTVKIIEHLFTGHHYYVVARTRYLDDLLKQSLANSIKQVVIMGAGFDSRAYRFDALKEISVFEIDHPATTEKKKDKIKRILGSLPGHVIYVPVDFLKEKLSDKLTQSGYSGSLKSLFIWEGTTPYLTSEAVDETLAFVSTNSGNGSTIIFDYIFKSVLNGTCDLEGARNEFEKMKKTSEPMTFGIEADNIEPFLSERGFINIKDVGSEYLRQTYFKDEYKNRKIKPWWRIVYANTK